MLQIAGEPFRRNRAGPPGSPATHCTVLWEIAEALALQVVTSDMRFRSAEAEFFSKFPALPYVVANSSACLFTRQTLSEYNILHL